MKKFELAKTVLLIVVIAWLALPAAAQNHEPIGKGGIGSWRLLGERVIDYGVDRDFITVTGNDVFRKLKFKIIHAPVQMRAMKVVFENGEIQDIPLNFRMEQGHESRLIDLNGIARRIKVVYFNCNTARAGYRGKAKLILFGQK